MSSDVQAGICVACGGAYGAHYGTCRTVRQSSEDHGISPAQLREKVEALEQSRARWVEWAQDETKRVAYTSDRLDAALKRIEQLERNTGLRDALMPARPSAPIDQEDV